MIAKGTPILISSVDLLYNVSWEDIASRYIRGFQSIGVSFKSEFRREGAPSSRVFWGNHGELMFKDFGDPMLPKAINVIKYVQHKYGLNYQETLNKIAIDFKLINADNKETKIHIQKNSKIRREIPAPSNLVIKIKRREWSELDKEYWGSYSIPIKLLERNKIYPISHVFYNNYRPIEYTKNHLIYSYDYYWSLNIFRRKIYQPKSIKEKWRTNTDYTVVQNYPNIPKLGDLLFIQSSYKDCMVMELLGYHAIAPNKEGSWMPDYYWEKLRARWKHIVIFWDNDWEKPQNSGLIMAQKFSEEYNLKYIVTPDIPNVTDISDFVQKHGLSMGKNLVDNLVKKFIL